MLGVARRRLGSGIVSTARARTTVVVTSPPPSPPVGLTARDPFRSGAGAGPGDADPPLGDGEEGLLRGRQGGESPHPRRRTPTYLPTYLPTSRANHSRPSVCPALGLSVNLSPPQLFPVPRPWLRLPWICLAVL
jgi:hypothetical protein